MNKADRDFAEKLVLEVERRPLIYAPSHPDHKDRYKIDLAWTSVAAEMNSTVEIVKRRWQNLRDSYGKNLAAQHRPKGSGAKSVTKFYLFDQMSFLASHMVHAPVHGNYGVQQESQEFTVEDDTSGPQEVEPSVFSTPLPTPSTSSTSASASTSFIIHNSHPHSKKRRLLEPSPGWEEAATAFLVSRQPKPEIPEMDFFKGLVPMVRDLSLRNKRLLYAEVTNLLVKRLKEQDQGDQLNVSFI